MPRKLGPLALALAALILTAMAAHGEEGEKDALPAQEVCADGVDFLTSADLGVPAPAAQCGSGRCRTIADCGGGCPGTTSCVGGSNLTCGVCTCHIADNQSDLFAPEPAPASHCPRGRCHTDRDCSCPGTAICVGGSFATCGRCFCII